MTFSAPPFSVFQRHTVIDFRTGFVPSFVVPTTQSLNPNNGIQGQTLTVTAVGSLYDSNTTFSLGAGITVSSTTIVNSSTATLVLVISPTATLGFRNLTTTGLSGSTTLANAFDVFSSVVIGTGDFYDYIFQFPDQGSFLRDPTIQQFVPQVTGSQPGVQLIIYNPVETNQPPIPKAGNALVIPPQLAQSTVALPGFWAMVTIQSTPVIPQLTAHPNIQIVNDRTLMFAQKPSVIQTKIDVSHINIIINIFGVYVRDGLQLSLAASTYVGPGDVIGASLFTAFWGFRAFSRATVGTKAVQLRRSSDGTVKDFVTLIDGTLDAASIATFQGNASLKVAKMYDQTGNGNDIAPTNPTFEQAFTPNVLNGMGVYNNNIGNNPNPTAYRLQTTFTILNTWSHCMYSVYNSQPNSPFSFGALCCSDLNELGLVVERDAAFNNAVMKNEGGGFDGGIPNKNVADFAWHVVVGVIDQNPTVTSYIYVDHQVPDPNSPNFTLQQYNGNPNCQGSAQLVVWGDDGSGPSSDQFEGLCAEVAWFTTPLPNKPWTVAQGRLLIDNAKAFWGV